MSPTTKLQTVGGRIRDARERKEMTQNELAKRFGITRSGIAQWESDTTSPSIYKTEEIAKLLETTPQWLAFGISSEPKIVYQPEPGSVTINEVNFGEKPTEIDKVRSWAVPADYLKTELQCLSTSGLIIWRIHSSDLEPPYERGDKVIVDTNAKKPSPSGMFLLWLEDGVGPSLNHVSVVPQGTTMIASVSRKAAGNGYEVPVDKLHVIGRVRGLFKNL